MLSARSHPQSAHSQSVCLLPQAVRYPEAECGPVQPGCDPVEVAEEAHLYGERQRLQADQAEADGGGEEGSLGEAWEEVVLTVSCGRNWRRYIWV